jgi:hypothetical protein
VGSLSTPAAHLSLTSLAEQEYAVDCGAVEDRKMGLERILDHNFLMLSTKAR